MKLLNEILQGLMKDRLPADTLSAGYLTLPNGLQLCWGSAGGLKEGDKITLPITFGSGAKSFMLPIYNVKSTMICSFSSSVSGNKLNFSTYDHLTGTASTSTNLAVDFFVIGGCA